MLEEALPFYNQGYLMSDDSNHSITLQIARLKDGDEAAAQAIWEVFFARVRGLAAKKLTGAAQRVSDEEDVAISAIHALYTGARDGRFDRLENRDDLWQILCMLTARKAALHWRRQKSRKELGESVITQRTPDGQLGIDQVIAGRPDQHFMETLTSASEDLLAMLDDRLREVAVMKLEGHTNQEIGDKLQRSVKSIERYLATIRQTWNPLRSIE